jgi:hypothetical protein
MTFGGYGGAWPRAGSRGCPILKLQFHSGAGADYAAIAAPKATAHFRSSWAAGTGADLAQSSRRSDMRPALICL